MSRIDVVEQEIRDNQRLQQYLIQDRQWQRHCRVAHARMHLALCKSAATPCASEVKFWWDVLVANGVEVSPENPFV